MRDHNFWCISFVSNEFFKHFQKTPKSWEKVCSITVVHQKPKKNTFTDLKTPQNCLFSSSSFSDNHEQKSWDTFAFPGRFSIHTGPTPPLIPQTMLDACIQNSLPPPRVGGGRTARKFEVRGNREMTEKYEYCSAVPRTFVQDCRYLQI